MKGKGQPQRVEELAKLPSPPGNLSPSPAESKGHAGGKEHLRASAPPTAAVLALIPIGAAAGRSPDEKGGDHNRSSDQPETGERRGNRVKAGLAIRGNR